MKIRIIGINRGIQVSQLTLELDKCGNVQNCNTFPSARLPVVKVRGGQKIKESNRTGSIRFDNSFGCLITSIRRFDFGWDR